MTLPFPMLFPQVLCVGNLYNPDVRYSFNIPIEEHREQFVWDPSGSWLECNRICQGKISRLPSLHTWRAGSFFFGFCGSEKASEMQRRKKRLFELLGCLYKYINNEIIFLGSLLLKFHNICPHEKSNCQTEKSAKELKCVVQVSVQTRMIIIISFASATHASSSLTSTLSTLPYNPSLIPGSHYLTPSPGS